MAILSVIMFWSGVLFWANIVGLVIWIVLVKSNNKNKNVYMVELRPSVRTNHKLEVTPFNPYASASTGKAKPRAKQVKRGAN